ncbi:MAG: dephospho-CoA kinase [Pseudomonadales bacterium]|nr:dephospho-CoA kinase [Pseudomonadales bacterium]
MTAQSKPFVVGVTGGIGSGKSAATAMFAELGVQVVDADIVARQVVEPGCPALARIAEHFGSHLLHPDGSLDRTALRNIVFSQASEREWLEALLHPLIREEIGRQLSRCHSPYSILSSPLLLETGQNKLVDTVLLIDVSEETQIERTRLRDGADTSKVEAIMASQWSREKRQRHADHILLNEGSLEELRDRIRTLHEEFLQQAALCQEFSEGNTNP